MEMNSQVGKGWGTKAEPTLLGEGLLKVVEQEEEPKEDSCACSGWRAPPTS